MVLIMNIDKDFQNIITKVVQMAQKVAQKMAQMSKNLHCIELSKNWHRDYFRHADYEYDWTFGKYYHQSAPNGTQSGTKSGTNV